MPLAFSVRVGEFPPNICDCGVIGSRKGLKIPRLVRTGSSPVSRTKYGLKVFMDAHSTVTAVDGDRYPIRPPKPALGP